MLLVYAVFGIYSWGYSIRNLTDCFTRTFTLDLTDINQSDIGNTITEMLYDHRVELDKTFAPHLQYALPISVSITKL